MLDVIKVMLLAGTGLVEARKRERKTREGGSEEGREGGSEGGREGGREGTLLELTIPFDTLLEDAARRKQAKYQDLVASVQESGYTVTLVTVEVGARGVQSCKGPHV